MNPESQPTVTIQQDPIKEQKRAILEVLRKQMVNDRTLPFKSANLIFGEGNVNAQVMFIGEAPGFMEDQQKKLFIGKNGEVIDKMFRKIGLPRRDAYLTTVIKRIPPKDHAPTKGEVEAYGAYLTQQIAIIQPKVIATLGSFTMNHFLPLAKINADHGKPQTVGDQIYFPLQHPAAALRVEAAMRSLEMDFFALGKFLGIQRPLPPPPANMPPPPPPPPPKEPEPEQFKLF